MKRQTILWMIMSLTLPMSQVALSQQYQFYSAPGLQNEQQQAARQIDRETTERAAQSDVDCASALHDLRQKHAALMQLQDAGKNKPAGANTLHFHSQAFEQARTLAERSCGERLAQGNGRTTN